MKIKYYVVAAVLIALIPIIMIYKSILATQDSCQLIDALDKSILPPDSSQVLIIKSLSGLKAQATACQKRSGSWHRVLSSPFPAVVGQQGIISANQKIEGDKKTPEGLYPLVAAFGTEPMPLRMDYKFITREDKFIDDPESPAYNTWVTGATKAKSFEIMDIPIYKRGAIVGYNMTPIIPGKGSAIFMHIWKNADTGTYGCIAFEESQLIAILHWLDKTQHPYIYITK
ncbi:L,D-transpeptidase [Legionella dresdenensis]|uniref:L,D-transpeptidase n=1 Tax=Legionella dresdenensis TaxID=450200 RepID=A0ABV8CB61_9GAMM